MKLCKDKDCLRYGIALNDSEFPRNRANATKGMRDSLSIYCRACSARRTREYRENLAVLLRRTKVRIPISVLGAIK